MKKAAWAVALAAAGMLFLYVAVYRLNGAVQDHLASTIAFSLWDQHAPMGHYLFQQHNEHRILVPRLVILGLGLLTRWNNVPEMFAHATLMCVTAVILFGAFRREGGSLAAFLPAMLMALSPRSYEALMGFGFPHYLEILFYVAALRLVVFDGGWISLTSAVLCGEGATFSLANGLWVWPVGLLVILSQLRTATERQATWTRAAVWTVASATTIGVYFHDYLPTGNHPDASFFAQHPLLALEHFLVLNGTVFAASVPAALVLGALALVLYVWIVALAIRDWRRRREPPPYGFWLVVSVIASNATVTAGRAIFGPIQALDSRYAAVIALAPIGAYGCVAVRRNVWPAAPALKRVLATLLVGGYAVVTVQTWAAAPAWYSRRKEAAYVLYTMRNQPDSEVLLKVAPIVSEARWFSSELERMHLNVFAEPHISATDLMPTPVRPPLRIETINGRLRSPAPIVVGPEDSVEVRGYAFGATGGGPARAMFVTIDSKMNLPAVTGLYRAGAAGPSKWTGFAGSFAGFVLMPGEHTLSLTVVSDDGRHAYVTDRIATIIRR
ncbi:MAG TPA: hypothetical protein VH138_04215 [Vicinamibacterales bacterium]|nr:hypothetical protein [Vicinamibacterales bacterium]